MKEDHTMTTAEKVAYLKGLAEGFGIDKETKEGKRFEGSYKNGERDGEFVERDRNGQVTARGEYKNGRRITQ